MFGLLVFGDSIVHGRGEQPSTGWVGRLKQEVELRGFHHCVFNLGVPGDTSSRLRERFETELRSRVRPVRAGDRFVVVIAIGTNDARTVCARGVVETAPEVFSENMRALVHIAKRYTSDVVLVGLTPVDEVRTTPFEDTVFSNAQQRVYDQIIQRVAQEQQVLFIDVFSVFFAQEYSALLEDGVHPNRDGYQLMYAQVYAQLGAHQLIP